MKLLIINGPNLNLLGKRQPEIYGSEGFESCYRSLVSKYPSIKFDYFQSNIEGEIIDSIHAANDKVNGIIINAGAYTHTSIAIGDAIATIQVPVIEVHISNIYAREEYRHVSYLAANCIGVIAGFGFHSYELAVEYFLGR
jgi:3-dehydroquinate dehydratase-2